MAFCLLLFSFVKWGKHSDNLHKLGNSMIFAKKTFFFQKYFANLYSPFQPKLSLCHCNVNEVTSTSIRQNTVSGKPEDPPLSGVNPVLSRLWLSVIRLRPPWDTGPQSPAQRQKCKHPPPLTLTSWHLGLQTPLISSVSSLPSVTRSVFCCCWSGVMKWWPNIGGKDHQTNISLCLSLRDIII